MSMLSAQMDELRKLATRYDELQVGSVKAVTIPSNMGSILREAADTIWRLRDDLQRAHRENAKLRESAKRLMTQPFWHRMADEEPSDEKGKYLLLGKRGAMYLANGFRTWEHSQRKSFYIPNNRSGHMDFDKVEAWAVVPEMEVEQ